MTKRYTTLTAILLLLFTCTSPALCSDNLVFAGLNSLNSDIALKVLEEAYESCGIKISRKDYPILRAVRSADMGIVDGEIFKVKNLEKQYPDLVMVPVPVNYIELMVMMKKTSPPLQSWEKLKEQKIGIYRGVIFTRKMTAKSGCKKVYEFETHEQIVKMIQLNRIDVGLFAKIAGKKIIKQLGATELTLTEPPLVQFPVYHYLNKKHAHLVPQIAKALKQMQVKGRIQQIRNEKIQKAFGNNL